MNNRKAKKLRKFAKKIKPWVQYVEKTFHAVGKDVNDNIVLFVDPIRMGKCGRLFYKGLKQRHD